MKAYKVIDIIKMLEADGWYSAYTKGDHRPQASDEKRKSYGQRQTFSDFRPISFKQHF